MPCGAFKGEVLCRAGGPGGDWVSGAMGGRGVVVFAGEEGGVEKGVG